MSAHKTPHSSLSSPKRKISLKNKRQVTSSETASPAAAFSKVPD